MLGRKADTTMGQISAPTTLTLFDHLDHLDHPPAPPTPAGATFDPVLDGERLGRQYRVVFRVVSDGGWWTLDEIKAACGEPEASISARLRDFRKAGHTVYRRRRGEPQRGHWEYRLEEKR